MNLVSGSFFSFHLGNDFNGQSSQASTETSDTTEDPIDPQPTPITQTVKVDEEKDNPASSQ